MTFTHILDKSLQRNLDYFNERISQLDVTRRWTIKVSEYKSKRSSEQNRRLWLLYNAIGKNIGETPDNVHQLMGYKFLRYQHTVNGESVESIKSTTKLNTKQMTEYQDSIEMWCSEIGFIFDEDMS